MAVPHTMVYGIVKNGIVVPEGAINMPEGARVEIILTPVDVPPELRAEFAAWETTGDEAWALIEQWEKEDAS